MLIIIAGILALELQSKSILGTTSQTSNLQNPKEITVTLYVIPAYGGSGFDALVLASNFNGTLPQKATNTTPPGFNNNTIVVPANVPIKFIIINLDTMAFNFTGTVTVPFTVINDTNEGQVATTYSVGMQLNNFPAGHTFSLPTLGIHIPLPPTSIVTFTYTFTQPGQYTYTCETPCGPGMGIIGYMQGIIIVK